jgi:methylenetetrahydrofolate--tRNA-(uracil-5-)-methyltransferase
MHRNTFVDAPRVLNPDLSLRSAPLVFLAGQVSGCEGYVEAAATGIIAAENACRKVRGIAEPFVPPATTAIGSLMAYLRDDTSHNFQPQNVSFAYMTPLDTHVKDKRQRRSLLAQRALAEIDDIARRWQAAGSVHEIIPA